MVIGQLRTHIIEDHTLPVTEGGYFDLKVVAHDGRIGRSSSPREYVNNVIALHLRSAIESTGVPREHWYIAFSDHAQREFNFPETVQF